MTALVLVLGGMLVHQAHAAKPVHEQLAFPREASKAARERVEENPEDWKARVEYAQALVKQGACGLAIEQLDAVRASGTANWNAQAATMLGSCLMRKGYLGAAQATLEEAVTLDAGAAVARLRLAQLGLELGDLELVDEHRAWFELDERTLRTARLLDLEESRVLGEVDIQWEAELLRDTLDQKGSRRSSQNSLFEEGMFWLDQGHPYAAAQAFGDVLDTNVQRWDVSLQRAEAFRRMGMTRQVQVILERPLLSRVDVAMKDAVQARVLVDLGRLDEAEAVLRGYGAAEGTELLESWWYLARARGDEPGAQALAEIWNARNLHPTRGLEQLVPIAPPSQALEPTGDDE